MSEVPWNGGILVLGSMVVERPKNGDVRGAASGSYVTVVVVDDVDPVFARAEGLGVRVVEPPTDLFYGQRRMLVIDPNGVLVDVSSPTAPAPEYLGVSDGG